MNNQLYIRGLERGPWHHQKVMWVVKNLKNKNKKKKVEKYEGPNRVNPYRGLFNFNMPPSLPMVSLVRSYVRAVHMPQSSWGCDGGRIANLALDESDYHSAG